MIDDRSLYRSTDLCNLLSNTTKCSPMTQHQRHDVEQPDAAHAFQHILVQGFRELLVVPCVNDVVVVIIYSIQSY
jgi:hypothetical protein